MKNRILGALAALGLGLSLAACGGPHPAGETVEAIVYEELTHANYSGDAEEMATIMTNAILDGACTSLAYELELSDPDLLHAHQAGCRVFLDASDG